MSIPLAPVKQETSTTPSLYVPKNSRNLLQETNDRVYLGLAGEPGTGKTYSVIRTFPNVVVLDYDNKLGQHAGMDVIRVPMWDHSYVKDVMKCCGKVRPSQPSVRDATIKWLENDATKLARQQTLFFDSWSMFQLKMDGQHHDEPEFSAKTGKEDGFAFWGRKLRYSGQVFNLLDSLNCNVVVSFHLTREFDEEGKATGRFKPVMQGQFADLIAGKFPNWYRQVAKPVKDKEGKDTGVTEYLWQVKTNVNFAAITSRKWEGDPLFVPATYQSLLMQ